MIPVMIHYYRMDTSSRKGKDAVGLFDLETGLVKCPDIQAEPILLVADEETWRSSNRYDSSFFCYITDAPQFVIDRVFEIEEERKTFY